MLIYKRNEDNENIVEMQFDNPTYKETAFIDLEDLIKVQDYSWSVNKTRKYVIHNKSGKTIMLHRLIMDCPEDKVVNHIDGNPLNNTKANLEIVTLSVNLQKAVHSGKTANPKTHKLTQAERMDVVEMYKSGIKIKDIATKYNLYYNAIRSILKIRNII